MTRLYTVNLDADGYILSIANTENDNVEIDLDNFELDYMNAYKVQENSVVLDEDKKQIVIAEKAILDDQLELFNIRERRQTECFAVCDRSRLWYDELTSEQLAELRQWRLDWLNATETRIIPPRPDWL